MPQPTHLPGLGGRRAAEGHHHARPALCWILVSALSATRKEDGGPVGWHVRVAIGAL